MADIQKIMVTNLTYKRALDVGNPTSGNIGADFGRILPSFWNELKARENQDDLFTVALDDLNGWRNAIAHDDFTKRTLRPHTLCLRTVDTWRRKLGAMARCMNDLLWHHLRSLARTDPWQ